ncbi:glycine cleavage system protein GcvH [Pseudomonas shirazensis]|jgi:glycine cleavage system H protein|uniref:Glycine cleavage system H protein n=2 Tax=Pseudomonas TaxID=286 RepID=A0A5E6QLS1_PSEFL|nr:MULTISPECIES: glycine cleavage system protein GcvH [Pseudomonas]AUF95148.1 glycine cleavage system protein H [Pseudomonas sp. 02C 26]MBA1198783.1 glycine cleavage system protein GcvH [Pseudomonas plecoglossicida]MBA1324471.1 glycine cleavage system protein GcvH [Pseudomonas plecoglossicida]MBO0365890.1 glycine cleavage system protein GcvH [Pseudomonas putida]MCS4284660.1 glycine cleavage system H protein [Pseudomonas sp. BIGb0278]
MSELRFTEDHEWLRSEADGSVTVGITAFAQNALGDVVYVQLPELQHYEQGAEASTVESVKAASGVYMPLTGEVLEVNQQLADNPELVNEDPLGAGWFFRFQPADADAVAKLLDQDAYDRLIKANADA